MTAHVRSAILCDFAQVREGLLFVMSGGITRVLVPNPESPVSFYVAGQIELASSEIAPTHNVEFKVTHPGSAATLWSAELSFATPEAPPGLFPGEPSLMPFAIGVGPFIPGGLGPHDFKVSAGQSETELLTFYVVQLAV
jgi:hypothetical protein